MLEVLGALNKLKGGNQQCNISANKFSIYFWDLFKCTSDSSSSIGSGSRREGMDSFKEELIDAVMKQSVEKVRNVTLPNPSILKEDKFKTFLKCLLRAAIDYNKDTKDKYKLLSCLLEKLQITLGDIRDRYFTVNLLMSATSRGLLDYVKIILEKIKSKQGTNPSEVVGGPNDYVSSEEGYITPMMLALKLKKLDIVKYFMESGYYVITDPEKEEEGGCNKKGVLDTLKDRVLLFLDDLKPKGNKNAMDVKSETQIHRRIEYYRASADPVYICYKCIYDNSKSNPVYEVLHLQKELRSQAWIDKEFKEEYKALSYQCEDFVEELMTFCRSHEETRVLTDVCKAFSANDREHLKHIIISNDYDKSKESLTFLNWAIKEDCEKLTAHPFNQLRLNAVIYPERSIWRKATNTDIFVYMCLILLVLPFLALLRILAPFKNTTNLINYLEQPVVKFVNHFWSMLMFNSLLIASAFRNQLDELPNLSVLEWLILVWLAGIFLQVGKELLVQRWRRYFAQWWSAVKFLMLCCFVSSYVLKFFAFTLNENVTAVDPVTNQSAWYRLILISNSLFVIGMVLSFMHLSVVLQVSQKLGPLQLSLYHLIKDVMEFIMFFSFVFFAFWISFRRLYEYYITTQKHIANTREKSTNSTETETDHTYSSIHGGMYGLFWSIFGYTDLESFKTKDTNITTPTGHILFGLFQLFAVIIAINMLIAMMTRSFDDIMNSAKRKWTVSRTCLWMFWVEEGSILPPPLNLLLLLEDLVCYLCQKIKSTHNVRNSFICCCAGENDRNKIKSEDDQYTAEEETIIYVIMQRYLGKRRKELNLTPNCVTERLRYQMKKIKNKPTGSGQQPEACSSPEQAQA